MKILDENETKVGTKNAIKVKNDFGIYCKRIK
jgi:hypothetical protein